MEIAAANVMVLISQAPGPPVVTVSLPDEQVTAALLIWGRSQYGDWRAGVCYIYKNWHTRALVTTWAPAVRVSPHPATDYQTVPRVRLPGDPSHWPKLPPRYPKASEEWLASHQHLAYGETPRPGGNE